MEADEIRFGIRVKATWFEHVKADPEDETDFPASSESGSASRSTAGVRVDL